MRIIEDFRYRSEIDGLRAIAVLSVVLFHAGFGLSGGYVGVDVFFVISGYLITSLIWKDLEGNKFSAAVFWERRARRIIPALLAVTAAVLVTGCILFLPEDLGSLGRATAAQMVFAANVHYWLDSNYFAAASNEKPLLHTWSLAVEEQFYLIVPFLLWGLFQVKRLRTRFSVLLVLGTCCMVSFLLSIYLTHWHPQAAFYLLPTRAWELMLGSILAFCPVRPGLLKTHIAREIIAIFGALLVFVPIFLYTESTPFPGLAALPPCLGAVLLIWANGRTDSESTSVPTFVGRLLSMRPVVFVGLISYSLYLWHWPFLAFFHYLTLSKYELLPVTYRIIPVGLGFIFGFLSWKYVETPFRTRKAGSTQKSMFALAGSGILLLFVCGLFLFTTQGLPIRFSHQALQYAKVKSEEVPFSQITAKDALDGKFINFGASGSTMPPVFFVWGDSHGQSALPAIDLFLKENGLAGQAATISATPPLIEFYVDDPYGLSQKSLSYNASVLSYIEKEQIPNVILVGRWESYALRGKDPAGSFETIDVALVRTVRRLVAAGSKPWVMLDVPNQTFDVPKALTLNVHSKVPIANLYASPKLPNEFEKREPKLTAEIQAAGGQVIDPKPSFLDATGQFYVIEANGCALYRDEQHLTAQGAKIMLLPLLRNQLKMWKLPPR